MDQEVESNMEITHGHENKENIVSAGDTHTHVQSVPSAEQETGKGQRFILRNVAGNMNIPGDKNVTESVYNANEAGRLFAEKPRPSHPSNNEGDDLDIYDDPGDGDDLSDTEIEPLRTFHGNQSFKRTSSMESAQTKGNITSQSILRTSLIREQIAPQDEPSHVTWSAQQSAPRTFSDYRYMSGNRGKPNTPASHFTEGSTESRNTSRVPSESREAMFRRAMTLLSARCTSVQPGIETPFGMARQLPFGVQLPQYFYIRQEKPTPMPPLKAWQGYNGNVYFEPIQISSVRDPPTKSSSSFEKPNDLHRMLASQQKQQNRLPDRPESDALRSLSRNTTKTSSSNRPMTRQMVLLDKRVVLDRYNDDIQSDIHWIEGSENTGSLAVRPKSEMLSDRPVPQTPQAAPQRPSTEQNKKKVYNKERICKGSVVHKLKIANKSNQPRFKVNGGKYSSSNSTSPLLRTQTQYSHSNQRLTTNSPDIASQLLPPLEQLRSQVKRMDHANEKLSKARPVTFTDEMKPFIKYSPEVKAKAGFV